MNSRPELTQEISVKDFNEFYWLKDELIRFCRKVGLRTSGSKIEISKRIVNYLKSGDINSDVKRVKSKSKFDWNNEILSLDTVITDNYKNTENVRTFFQTQLDRQFKFNVKFMNWMKINCGKTLEDAILEWSEIKTRAKSNLDPKEIAPQFEYNTYLRDFMADNPGAKREIGIILWKIKKSQRGDNKYCGDDLSLLVGVNTICK